MEFQDENPYASPIEIPTIYSKERGENANGLRREGKVLVAEIFARFPDRCVKCNAPAHGSRLKRKLYWHHPLIFLVVILGGPLLYAIVALICRKSAEYLVPICPAHRSRRNTSMFLGWGGFLASIGLFVGAGTTDSFILGILGVGLLLAALIIGVAGTQLISPKRISDRYAWINGAGREFLDSLDS